MQRRIKEINHHREGDNFYAMLVICEEMILVVMIVVRVLNRVFVDGHDRHLLFWNEYSYFVVAEEVDLDRGYQNDYMIQLYF